MKKKIGFNIMLFVFITHLIALLSCSQTISNPSLGILLKTDSAFSAMSYEEGMYKAFLYYMADDGVILRNNSYPDKGKELLRQRFEGKSDTSFTLIWEPLFEKISESGDLGYTVGIHSSKDNSTGLISQGTYVTIWEKQVDGSWKFVLDTGTEGLPENLK